MRERKALVIEIGVGILLIGIGIVTHFDYYSSMIFSAGVGLSVGGIVQMIRIAYWQSPKHLAEYEEKKRDAYIDSVDERRQYMRAKAGQIVCQTMMLVLFLLAWALAVFRAEAWVIRMICLLFVLQWVIWGIAIRVLEKRM